MFNLKDYRERPKTLSDRLPWAALVAPGVILNKTGTLMSTFRYRGPDLDSSTREHLLAVVSSLNNTLKRIDEGWSLFVETARHETVEYPKSRFPNIAALMIDEERRIRFQESTQHFESSYHITLVWMPPTDQAKKAGSRLIENSSASTKEINRWGDVSRFESIAKSIYADLATILNECEMLTDGYLLAYLHSTISTRRIPWMQVPEVPMYLDSFLADEPWMGGLEPRLGKKHIRLATIRFFPNDQWPGVLDELNHLNVEYRYVSRWIALGKLSAEKELESYRDKWFSKRKSLFQIIGETFGFGGGDEKIDQDAQAKGDAANASIMLSKGEFVGHGYYTGTIVVWDDDANVAQDKIEAIQGIINRKGYTCIIETQNAAQAWFGTHPGNTYANVRRPMLNTLNLGHILPMSAVWAGHAENKHLNGPPLMVTRTTGYTPYRLCTHEGDLGHLLCLGPTGAGKSTLINLCAMQFQRYEGANVIIFDKKRSAYVPTMSVGGSHYELGKNEGALKLQPLRHIDSEGELSWAHGWICGLLQLENVEITPAIKDHVWEALKDLSEAAPDNRTITAFCYKVQDEAVRDAIRAYTSAGPYGFIMDGNKDPGLDASWLCFEMEDLMNIPAVVPGVLEYLFHELEKRFQGHPTILLLDEAWLMLDNPQFRAKIREWLKILRDKNVSVWFATQSLDEVAKSEIVHVLIESCPTKIYLPNPSAMSETSYPLYQQFGLNRQQIRNISQAAKKRDYYFVSTSGTRMFELDLGPIQLAFLSSGVNNVNAAKSIIAEHGMDNFAYRWLLHKGLDDAAEVVKELQPA